MENNIEIWKDIFGFEGFYQISNLGRIKSCRRLVRGKHGMKTINETILKLGKDKDGYLMAILCKNATKKTVKVHRLVADAFIDKFEGKNLVNHLDFDKSNNYFKNLEWVSSIENNCHKTNYNNNLTSKFVGVHFNKKNKYFRAVIGINGKQIHLGSFKTEEEAYKKRCDYELKNNINNKYL